MRKQHKRNGYALSELLFLVPICFFVFFVTHGINLPYVGYNAWNYNTYSQIAKNYNTFGFLRTEFAPIITVSKTFPSNPVYYLHHPPLISISEALLFRVLGNAFWVGRLTVIVYSIASLILLYCIGSLLRGRAYGLVTLGVASLLPAEVIFGRMIGMEPLVLFFMLFVLYMTLLYRNTTQFRYALFGMAGIILGVLSDWPMVYFTVLLLPLVWPKSKKIAIAYVVTAGIVEALYLCYVYFLMHGFSDLLHAITNRSVGALTHLPNWPLVWIGLLGIRFFLYYNPLFVIISAVVLYYQIKKLAGHKRDIWTTTLLICFIFAFLFVVLYPEGSFGHAYWIHFFVPFISLATADVLFDIYQKRQFALLVVILLISSIFLWRIELWKRKEVEANVWRYELMKQAAMSFKPYETVVTNPDGVIDTDLIMYAFNHSVIQKKPINAVQQHLSYYYLFSCIACSQNSGDVSYLTNRYAYRTISAEEGRGYVFNFKQPSRKMTVTDLNRQEIKRQLPPVPPQKETLLQRIYRQIKDTLHAPQI